ncbi:MAG: hypothetical protein LBB58_01785 [Cellulomonadaceae bacterium]|nr:hypothetical protein [Cellulomonadaceae bacterium]
MAARRAARAEDDAELATEIADTQNLANGGTGITLPDIATDHYALFNRRRMEPSQPEIINAIMEAVDATS